MTQYRRRLGRHGYILGILAEITQCAVRSFASFAFICMFCLHRSRLYPLTFSRSATEKNDEDRESFGSEALEVVKSSPMVKVSSVATAKC